MSNRFMWEDGDVKFLKIVRSADEHVKELREKYKDLGSFTRNVRTIVRTFWAGDIMFGDFTELLSTQLELELWNAWDEGVKSCDMELADMTPEEKETLEGIVAEQIDFVHSFGVDIAIGNKAAGGDLQSLLDRAELWIDRYNSVKMVAQTMVCGDEKLKWVEGDTVKKCPFCVKLDGIVARASIWEELGVRPRNPPNPAISGEMDGEMGCEGWQCDCMLEPTNERQTPNARARIVEIVSQSDLNM
jgi:hypothetical protein